MENTNLENLNRLAKLFGTDRLISPEDIQEIRSILIGVLANNKKEVESLTEETKQAVESFLNKVETEHDKYLDETKQIAQELKSDTTEAINFTLKSLEEVKALCKEVMECKPENGEDADEEYVIGEVLNRIKLPEYKEIVLDDGGAIVDKINSLPVNEENQIDAKHIKNLPEVKGGKVISGGVTRKIVEQMIEAAGGGGTPGGSTTQLQYNNSGAFGGISGATTDGTAVTYTANNLKAADITASGSGGFLIQSNSGTDVGLFGAGGGAGATFYGGVNIDGSLTVDTDTLFVDATNNRVAVGSSTPSTVSGKLLVYENTTGTSTATGLIIEQAGTGDAKMDFLITGTRRWIMGVDNSNGDGFGISSSTGLGSADRLFIDVNGLIGMGTSAPTHTLTLPSTSTGIALYNTADQTTNYERGRLYWNSNVLTLTTENGGSGTARSVIITNGANRSLTISPATSAVFQFAAGSSGLLTGAISVTNSTSLSSGTYTQVALTPTINQSSTAGYTALLVNPTETTTGSGSKLLADFQIGGSSKAKIDNTGLITAPQVINTPATITVTSNAGTVTRANRINNFTNSSAATMTITMSTTSAADGDMVMVRIKDFSAVAQTITWVNTENSTVTAPTTSNGSTTLPLTVGFQYNSSSSKWRCIASA